MRLIVVVLGLILLCTACAPAISATYQHYSGPEGQGWVVEQNLTPIINPNTGLPYTSQADYVQNTDPACWNNMTPEERTADGAMPAITGYTTISSPAFDLTDEQFARVMKENMTNGETYAWLYPDFWAAVLAVGADKTIDWNLPMIMYDDIPSEGSATTPSNPGITVADGNTTRTIPADSPEAQSLLTDQQIRFLTGKIPFDSPVMKTILGDQQWNTLNSIQQYKESLRVTSTNTAITSTNASSTIMSGMIGIPNTQAFQSVSGISDSKPNTQVFQSVSIKEVGSSTGSSAGLIKKFGQAAF